MVSAGFLVDMDGLLEYHGIYHGTIYHGIFHRVNGPLEINEYKSKQKCRLVSWIKVNLTEECVFSSIITMTGITIFPMAAQQQ
jgi:hypothetical protein